MGQRGPSPLPAAIKKQRGTFRPDRDSGADNSFSDKRPTCPAFLSTVARAEWRRVVNELGRVGLLKNVDRAALAAYCQSYAVWVAAVNDLDKEGVELVLNTESGYRYPNPILGIVSNARSQMLILAREFGMTPSARTRVIIDKGRAEQLSLADLLFDAVNSGNE